MTTPRQLFLNLPVRDLEASKAFFAKLGFRFDERFSDDKACCVIFTEDAAYVMLLTEPFFDTFTQRKRCDTSSHCESIHGLSCVTKEEVIELTQKAVEAGGKRIGEPMDHGFMYSESFADLDGHHWELIWMDMEAAAKEM